MNKHMASVALSLFLASVMRLYDVCIVSALLKVR